MELMKLLFLLCVVAAASIDNVQRKDSNDHRYPTSPNNSLLNFDSRLIKGEIQQKKVYLNRNGNSMVSKSSALKEVFTDELCKDCINCMERAIKAHRVHTLITSLHPSDTADELYTADNVPIYQRDYRFKRGELKEYNDKTKPTVNNTQNNAKGFEMHTEIISTISKLTMNIPANEYFQVNETKLRILTHQNKSTEVQTSEATCRLYKVLDIMPCQSEKEQERKQDKPDKPTESLSPKNKQFRTKSGETRITTEPSTTIMSWIEAIVDSLK